MNHVIYGKSYVVLQAHACVHSVCMCLSVCSGIFEFMLGKVTVFSFVIF